MSRGKWVLMLGVFAATVLAGGANPATANIIFCRNVFIYFSQEAIRRVVSLFANKMISPGYLFVGASESLFRWTNEFDFLEIGGAFIYARRPGHGQAAVTDRSGSKLLAER